MACFSLRRLLEPDGFLRTAASPGHCGRVRRKVEVPALADAPRERVCRRVSKGHPVKKLTRQSIAASTFTLGGFAVHVLTASGAAFALLALMAAVETKWAAMFAWLGAALVVAGVGGGVEFKNNATIATNGLDTPGATIGCNLKFREDFAGVQFGQDIARLNAMGWNLHLGTTAGYLETKGSPVGGKGRAFNRAINSNNNKHLTNVFRSHVES
jgi:hypothetical protein